MAIDGEELQQAVLVPVRRPPFGREETAFLAVISRTGPCAERFVIEIEGQVAGPVFRNAGSLRGNFKGELDLYRTLSFLQVIRQTVFNVTGGEPKNAGLKALGIVEIARIVLPADQFPCRGYAAGRRYAIVRVLSDGDFRGIVVLRCEVTGEVDGIAVFL